MITGKQDPRTDKALQHWSAGWRWIRGGLLGIGIVLAIGLGFAADAPVRLFARDYGTASQKELAGAVSKYSKSGWIFSLCLLGWGVGRLRRRRDWQRRWIIVAAATAVAGIAVNVPRSLTGRARPNNQAEQGWFGPRHEGQWLIGRYQYNSFPSGHTTTAAGFALAVLVCFRRFGGLAVAGALIVGWARIWVNAHHFSDVLVGLGLGAALAWCVCGWFRERGWVAAEGDTANSQPAPLAQRERL